MLVLESTDLGTWRRLPGLGEPLQRVMKAPADVFSQALQITFEKFLLIEGRQLMGK